MNDECGYHDRGLRGGMVAALLPWADTSNAAIYSLAELAAPAPRFETRSTETKTSHMRGVVMPHRATIKLSGSLMKTTLACMYGEKSRTFEMR